MEHAEAAFDAAPARTAVLDIGVASGELPPSAEVERAVQRWAAARAADVSADLAVARRNAVLTSVAGFALLCLFTLCSHLLERAGGDRAVVDLIASGLQITAWVSLWFPFEAVVFGLWRIRSTHRTWTTLASARVEVHPLRLRSDRPVERSRATSSRVVAPA
jgi:hypothetical protein